MTKPRVTTADRLSNIIEVVELGRRSGLLSAERGSSQTIEQGEVYFAQGRAVYAAVEGLRGREALVVLAGWGQCRFAFEPNTQPPPPNISAPPPASVRSATNPNQGSGFFPQPPPARSAPASYHWGAPSNRSMPDPMLPNGFPPATSAGPQAGPQTGPRAGGSPSTPSETGAFGASWPTDWPPSAPSAAPTSTGHLRMPGQGGSQAGSLGSGQATGSGPIGSDALQRRPRRAPDVRDLIAVVNTYNLSRNHRTILLLADGEHTLFDLARLSSKQVDEVSALLADLERLGLVYYY
jgi:hypothetical protein